MSTKKITPKSENQKFFKKLVKDFTVETNPTDSTIDYKMSFTPYKLSKEELKKIRNVVTKQEILVFPKENPTQGIEGYLLFNVDIHTKKKTLELAFGGTQLPNGCTLKALFRPLCHSEKNQRLLILADGDRRKIKEKFEEYCY